VFLATPAVRCFAPGRAFATEHEAKAFAAQAASHYRVGYYVWEVIGGRSFRKLVTFPSPDRDGAARRVTR
jgi:hypothetical protein